MLRLGLMLVLALSSCGGDGSLSADWDLELLRGQTFVATTNNPGVTRVSFSSDGKVVILIITDGDESTGDPGKLVVSGKILKVIDYDGSDLERWKLIEQDEAGFTVRDAWSKLIFFTLDPNNKRT